MSHTEEEGKRSLDVKDDVKQILNCLQKLEKHVNDEDKILDNSIFKILNEKEKKVFSKFVKQYEVMVKYESV